MEVALMHEFNKYYVRYTRNGQLVVTYCTYDTLLFDIAIGAIIYAEDTCGSEIIVSKR